MKRNVFLCLALIALVLSFILPVIGGGGWGEWPCQMMIVIRPDGPDLDCLGNSGDCLCLVFNL